MHIHYPYMKSWLFDLTNMGIMCSQHPYIDGFVQERRNSSALAMELRLSCTNPSICNPGCL